MQDAQLYIETLVKAFIPHIGTCPQPPILQQDGAPSHRASSVKAFFASQEQFSVLQEWPPRSPDLNPIENLWAWLAQAVRKRTRRPENTSELVEFVSGTLATAEAQRICRSLCASFEGRLRKCVAKGGDHIDH